MILLKADMSEQRLEGYNEDIRKLPLAKPIIISLSCASRHHYVRYAALTHCVTANWQLGRQGGRQEVRWMKKKMFSEEEQALLRQSPYVISVTERQVVFSETFKAHAYEEYQKGNLMKEIFRSHGLDPDILGDTRIYGFTENLKRKARAGKKFGDDRRNNLGRPLSERILEKSEIDYQKEISRLEARITLLEQEIELLKKTNQADMAARLIWESRQNRQKSSKS